MVHIKITAILLMIAMMIPAYSFASSKQDEMVNNMELFVSPTGNDSNNGTIDKPIATFDGAVKAVRQLKKNAGEGATITVNFRQGEYYLENSVSFDKNDSGFDGRPIIYQSYKNERAVFKGSVYIEPSHFTEVKNSKILNRLSENARGKVGELDLKKEKISAIEEYKTPTGFKDSITSYSTLFLNEKEQPISRYPNYDFVNFASVIQGSSSAPATFTYKDNKIDRWVNAKEAIMEGYFNAEYAYERVTIASFDTGENTITTGAKTYYGVKEGKRWAALNLLEEIDSPGEWYIDRTNLILYYYLPYTLNNTKLYLSMLKTPMVVINDASNITFRNLDFKETCDNGFKLNNSNNITIDKCSLVNIGTHGIVMNEGKNNIISNSDIFHVGAKGIFITAGDRQTLIPANHKVVNNHLYDLGKRSKTYNAGIDINGVGQTVEHNLIHEAPHFAIYFSGNESSESGDYNIYLGNGSINAQSSVFVAKKSDQDAALLMISSATSATDLEVKLTESERMLSLNFRPYKEITKGHLALTLYNAIKTEPGITADVGSFQNYVNELSVIEAFNQGKRTILTDNGNNFIYSEVMKINTVDKNGSNVLSLFNSEMNQTGKVNVVSDILNKNFSDLNVLHDAFAESVVINSLKNYKDSGYGHISGILSKNSSLISLNILKYNSLKDKSSANSELLKESYTTKSELQKLINSFKNPTETDGGGGKGSGSVNTGIEIHNEVSYLDSLEQNSKTGFNDLADVEWAKEAITYMSDKKILNGKSEASFAPMDNITREEFVKMIVLALGYEVYEESESYNDVENGQWYKSYVDTAKRIGLVNGYSDGTFGIGSYITREDMAVMLHRAISVSQLNKPQIKSVNFKDESDISSYAKDAINYLSGADIISGMGDGSFVPKNTATRAEAAVMIYKTVK